MTVETVTASGRAQSFVQDWVIQSVADTQMKSLTVARPATSDLVVWVVYVAMLAMLMIRVHCETSARCPDAVVDWVFDTGVLS